MEMGARIREGHSLASVEVALTLIDGQSGTCDAQGLEN